MFSDGEPMFFGVLIVLVLMVILAIVQNLGYFTTI